MSHLGAPEFGWKPLQYKYDLASDVLTVEGLPIAGRVFRLLSAGIQFDTYLRADEVLDAKVGDA